MTKITLTILGKVWEKKGETIEDALSKFDLSWEQIKGKGIINISEGKKKHTQIFPAPVLRRIFNNKMTRSYQAKNFALLLK